MQSKIWHGKNPNNWNEYHYSKGMNEWIYECMNVLQHKINIQMHNCKGYKKTSVTVLWMYNLYKIMFETILILKYTHPKVYLNKVRLDHRIFWVSSFTVSYDIYIRFLRKKEYAASWTVQMIWEFVYITYVGLSYCPQFFFEKVQTLNQITSVHL